ncbi:MAG: MBL fold metallo-hydrolase [Thermodesulfobacteriota bacterium]
MKYIVQEQEHGLDNPHREGLHHIGNSTHWIVFDGVKILTDPWLAEPAEHMLIHSIPPIPLPIDPDIVLISHEHDDHFDPEALSRLDKAAFVVAPEGKVADAVEKMNFSELYRAKPEDSIEVRGVIIDVVKGKHNVPELCYRVKSKDNSFFFGGDSMVTKEIEQMADQEPVPFVILPGEYSSILGFRFVMTPEEAVLLASRFRAKQAVLTHHEQLNVGAWWFRWLVRINKVPNSKFPDWFSVPKPGDYVQFPWDQNNYESKEAAIN